MKIGLLTAVACTCAASALADDTVNTRYETDADRTRVAHEESHDWKTYGANELEVGIFGSGTVGRRTLENPSSRRIERNGKLGAGASVGYFFHRYVGVEGYAYSESTSEHFVDNVGGDLLLRLPLGHTGLALYARYVWADETRDYGLGRVGLKFGF
jgi:hypothetical protein